MLNNGQVLNVPVSLEPLYKTIIFENMVKN